MSSTVLILAAGEVTDSLLAEPGPLHDLWQQILGMPAAQVVSAYLAAVAVIQNALNDPETFGYAAVLALPILALLLKRLNNRS